MLHLGLIMKGIPKIQWLEVIAALLLYATVLIYQGYQYGDGDQSQILPCLYAQDHPSAYAGDHYVQAYLHGKINERSIFHLLFRYLGYNQPWITWIWHLLLGTVLGMAQDSCTWHLTQGVSISGRSRNLYPGVPYICWV